MFNISVTQTTKPITADRIAKYIANGISTGLTKTAKEAQTAVIFKIGSTFKNRTPWYSQSSPIGIKVKAATGETLSAEISTRAYFGPLQEQGGIKLPFSSTHLAIPAKGGPLYGMKRIPDDLKPRALVRTGKAWIETTEKGTQLLVVHGLRSSGKYKGNVLMYILVKKATIKRTDFFEKPIEEVVRRSLAKNIDFAVRTSLDKLRSRS